MNWSRIRPDKGFDLAKVVGLNLPHPSQIKSKQRLDMDPAVASEPFVTTFADILSVFFYFKIATHLLKK